MVDAGKFPLLHHIVPLRQLPVPSTPLYCCDLVSFAQVSQGVARYFKDLVILLFTPRGINTVSANNASSQSYIQTETELFRLRMILEHHNGPLL